MIESKNDHTDSHLWDLKLVEKMVVGWDYSMAVKLGSLD